MQKLIEIPRNMYKHLYKVHIFWITSVQLPTGHEFFCLLPRVDHLWNQSDFCNGYQGFLIQGHIDWSLKLTTHHNCNYLILAVCCLYQPFLLKSLRAVTDQFNFVFTFRWSFFVTRRMCCVYCRGCRAKGLNLIWTVLPGMRTQDPVSNWFGLNSAFSVN